MSADELRNLIISKIMELTEEECAEILNQIKQERDNG